MITIKDVKAGAAIGQYRIELDNGDSLEINAAYLPPEYREPFSRIQAPADAALDEAAEAALRHAAACVAAEKAALALVARAEQCAAGLSRKLRQRGHPASAVAAVMARLAALDLVNDRRYAGLWLKGALSRGNRGPKALLLALRAKGVSRESAAGALDTALSPEAEDGLLRRRVEKAAGGKNAPSGGTALRLFLRGEGFSPDAIERYFE